MGVVPLEVAERRLLTEALKSTQGNQALAARLLQVERRRLYRMIRRFGLQHMTTGQ
jgi:transcriptional regulator with GAF, ATPase, and Fis domain